MNSTSVVSQCPVCGLPARYFSQISNGSLSYQVKSCTNCHVQFLDPQPSVDTLATIYSASYFLGDRTPENEERIANLKRATAQLYFSILGEVLGGGPRKLLEIGCGSGDFLLEAQLRGLDVTGLEISRHAADLANRRLGGVHVQVGTVETRPLPANTYDVIAFSDVVEHVRDPIQFLTSVNNALRPGGLAFIVTPSLDSWSSKLMGKRWMEYKVEHLYYFGRKAIRLALERAGFSRIHIRDNPKILSLDYVAHHFERFPVPGFSRLVSLARRVAPEALAHRPIQIVASGMIVTARKIP